MAETIKTFDQYEVTNGAVQWRNKDGLTEEAVSLGCTGSLETETEVKVVVKRCEGVETDNHPIPQKMTGKFVGHVPVTVLRKLFGFKTEGLKKGIYSYGMNSRAGKGIFTWDVYDITREIKKLIAFPNTQSSSGFKWSLENAGDEIAEIELDLSFLRDDDRQFYYEAFEDELEDAEVKEKWNKNFNLDLVKSTTPILPDE